MRVLITLFLLLLAGCAGPQRAPRVEPRALAILNGQTGATVGWDEAVSACAAADVVVIGEVHGHPAGLAFAAALFEDVLARSDRAALSLEFFERDEQAHLDDYLTGVTDEAAFRQRSRRSAGNYPAGHRAMVEAARAAHRPVIASNAPRPYVTLARRESYNRLRGLTPEQQRLFRIPDHLPEGRYAEDFRNVMAKAASHGGPKPGGPPDPEAQARDLDAMLRSQSLWDWTMAESIARAAVAGARPVVHVVGQFHCDHSGGLVQALASLGPALTIKTVSVVDERSDALRTEDHGRADFVVYVGPARAVPAR